MDAYPGELVRAVEALRELVLAGETYRHSAADFLGIGISDTQAVSYLYSRGDIGQSELGELLGCNTSSATALVDRLEAKQIAQRVPHPTDRRKYIVRLTDRGHTMARSSGRWFAQAFDHIDAADLPRVTDTLRAIATDLRANASLIADAPPYPVAPAASDGPPTG